MSTDILVFSAQPRDGNRKPSMSSPTATPGRPELVKQKAKKVQSCL
eukprot:CAMPEP_0185781784 /NCGR_PEP_ID=MMETSP1174-20130828/104032_1 /TAXON_ID=35687 /ORGANISM="Dictyocha speculum, Strain CCMP1381" /LENGTH=45 /DNA_ID= /DNA_START= /DNA_END= /DNA_ORIENTATION=